MLNYVDADIKAVLLTIMVLLVWLEMVEFSERSKLFDNKHQRKVLQVLTGPMILITWALFTNGFKGAIFAAVVPLLLSLKFYLIGTGKWVDDDTIEIISRKGQRKELLKGPMFYGIVLMLSTLLFWKTIRGMICILVLCFGDGFAEIVGGAIGKFNSIPWSINNKSFAGFFSFVIFGTVLSWLYITNFSSMIFHDFLPEGLDDKLFYRILIDVVVAAIVETLPIVDYDNFTIFLATLVTDIVVVGLL